jgi:putative toxin-antitoxin system antitoxin component (TIGR02293 family)
MQMGFDKRRVAMEYQPNPALDIGTHSQSEVIASIRAGFPLEVFRRIADRLTMTEKQLAALTNITTSTLTRRKKEGRLTKHESEKLFRIIRVFNRAVAVFDSEESALSWLERPLPALGGVRPLDYIDTDIGTIEVENVLGRIEHGVFS